MFINRENELRILNNEYIDSKFSFTVIYGRRRVGKTTLIKEYIKDKPSIYFLTTLESLTTLIKRFQNIVADFLNDPFLKNLNLIDFKQLFQYISKQNFEKKLIIIIDEFQYLTKMT